MMFRRSIPSLLCLGALAAATALSGCVVPPARQEGVVYAPVPVSRPVPVIAEYGRVERIGLIQVAQRPTGAGIILGGLIGAVVGHQFGGGSGKAFTTGAGAIGGAIAGNVIEGRTRRDDEVYRVQVRFDNGSVRDFDFERVDDLRTGDRVKFEGGQLHRV